MHTTPDVGARRNLPATTPSVPRRVALDRLRDAVYLATVLRVAAQLGATVIDEQEPAQAVNR